MTASVSATYSGLWAVGLNQHSQLGVGLDGPELPFAPLPHHINALPTQNGITAVSSGEVHTLVLLPNGELYSWGMGDNGRLGLGDDLNNQAFPRLVQLPSRSENDANPIRVTRISAGKAHNILLTDTGDVYTFGCSFFGRLGLGRGKKQHQHVPAQVKFAASQVPIAEVCAGGNHSGFLSASGDVYTCGWNKYGQLGNNSEEDSYYLVQAILPQGVTIAHIGLGERFTMCVDTEGVLYSCGRNDVGQLGLGHTNEVLKLTAVSFARSSVRVTRIACGANHTIAVTDANEIYTWGASRDDCHDNPCGRLGFLSKRHQLSPRLLSLQPTIGRPLARIDISANHRHNSIVFVYEGESGSETEPLSSDIYVFGWNKYNQLGFEGFTEGYEDIMAPTFVKTIAGNVKAECGGRHTLFHIQGLSGALLQHARDNDVEALGNIVTFCGEHRIIPPAVKYITDPSTGFTAAHYACMHDNPTMLTLLSKLHPKFAFQRAHKGACPSHTAAQSVSIAALKTVFELEPDACRLLDDDGRSILHVLLLNCKDPGSAEQAIKSLPISQLGIDCNARDKDGATAMHIALHRSWVTVGRLLVGARSSVLIRNNKDELPIDYLSRRDAYSFKEFADITDVCMVHVPDDGALVKKIIHHLQSAHLTTSAMDINNLDISDTNPPRCIVLVASAQSVAVAVDALRACPPTVPVLSIWKEKCDLPADLEARLFQRQFIDFSGDSYFPASAQSLQVGIQGILSGGGKKAGGDVGDVDAAVDDPQVRAILEGEPYLVVLSDDDSLQSAQLIADIVQYTSYPCVGTIARENLEDHLPAVNVGDDERANRYHQLETSKAQLVARCAAVILHVDQGRDGTAIDKKLRSLLVIGENHQRLIIVVQGNLQPLKVAPSLEYVLANAPVLLATPGMARIVRPQIQRLVEQRQLSTRLAAEQQALETELQPLEADLQRQLLARNETVPVA